MIKVKTVPAPGKAFRNKIFAKLAQFSNQAGGPSHWKVLLLEARDPKGKLVGGLVGETFWGWLYVNLLWVDESRRGSGVGADLMARAEKEAIRRGCRGSFLSTFSFQAPGFYKKIGYRVVGSLRDFPKGEKRHWLQKKLS